MNVIRKLKGREEPVRLIGVPVLVLPVAEDEGEGEGEVEVEDTEFKVAEDPIEDMARQGQRKGIKTWISGADSRRGTEERTSGIRSS